MRGFTILAAMTAAAPIALAQIPEIRTDTQGHRALGGIAGFDRSAPSGPTTRTPGVWSPLGPFGGDVQDVNTSATSPNVVLAAVAPGGSTGGTLYRSTDNGSTWAPVSQLAGESVYDIEFAPDGTAYIGTIDSVWKSTNAGANWTATNLNIGLNDQVFDIAIDPQNSQTLWIGVADALGGQPVNIMRSTDGGATWFNKTPPLGAAVNGKALAIDPHNSNIVYAGFGGSFGGGQLWVTTDGGTTWMDRSAGLPNRPINAIVHDGTRVLVVGGQLFGSQFFGLFSSPDLGVTWTPLHDATWPSLVTTDVHVDPANPAIIYVATTNAGLFKSIDGGVSWSFGVGGTASLSLNSVRPVGAVPPDGQPRVFLGCNSVGIARSLDHGDTFQLNSTGIGQLDVHSVAANPFNPQELAIAFQGQNNGGVYTSLDGGATWSIATGIPGTRYNTVAFAPTPPGLLFALSDGPSSIGNEALYRRNADHTWTYLGPNVGSLFETESYALAFSRTNPDLIFQSGNDFGVAGSEGTVWRSTDAGAHWTKVYESTSTLQSVRALLLVNDGSDSILVGGVFDQSGAQHGGAIRSIDGGTTWSTALPGIPSLFNGSGLAPAAGTPSTLYLSNTAVANATGGIYRSYDAGATWTFPGYPAAAADVAAHPTDCSTIAIAQSGSVRALISGNGGAAFVPFNTGLSSAGGVYHIVAAGGFGDHVPQVLLATTTGAYATELPRPCHVDLNGDSVVNVQDFLLFLQFFAAGGSGPDLNCDGQTSVSDFLAFLQAYAAGC